MDDGVYDVFLRFYLIGRYSMRAKKLSGVLSEVAVRQRMIVTGRGRVLPMC